MSIFNYIEKMLSWEENSGSLSNVGVTKSQNAGLRIFELVNRLV
jgi:hypothetical protein